MLKIAMLHAFDEAVFFVEGELFEKFGVAVPAADDLGKLFGMGWEFVLLSLRNCC
jgi:hypothetical protein